MLSEVSAKLTRVEKCSCDRDDHTLLYYRPHIYDCDMQRQQSCSDALHCTVGCSCPLTSLMTCSCQTCCRPCGGFLFWRSIGFSRGLVETPIQLLSVRPVLRRLGEWFTNTAGGLPCLASESLSHCSGLKLPSPSFQCSSMLELVWRTQQPVLWPSVDLVQ